MYACGVMINCDDIITHCMHACNESIIPSYDKLYGEANLANAKGVHADEFCPPLLHSLQSYTDSLLMPTVQTLLEISENFSVCCRAVGNRMQTLLQ